MILVDTEEFWQLMCDPRFVRTTLHGGRIGERIYVTFEAPDEIPGFIEKRIAEVRWALHPDVDWVAIEKLFEEERLAEFLRS